MLPAGPSAVVHPQEDQRCLGAEGESSCSEENGEKEVGGSRLEASRGLDITITEALSRLAEQVRRAYLSGFF